MPALWDKLLHFGVGIATGIAFWWVLERYARNSAQTINPICFLIMLVWGASGLFFFRNLGIPILSGTFFYMAFLDWDIPLYQWTGFKFLIHRSWLFHSVLIPMAALGGWVWLMQQSRLAQWQKSLANWVRDGAIGLSIGISAPLIWDALLSSTRRGFYIRGFSGSTSYLWLFVNLAVGIGLPLLIAWSMQAPNYSDRTER
ncbi:hypothetical protein IQ265_23930 [Nodosilinea sp. LEGE 06152]|uniref:hypothetical protein n=1 Tax=Nodosilinea sp. LEGE 06152 TaxID=2777966 RepID=UPI001880B296|nr:hypothetical protein [Nodosilinea sp. LEGE 06152]MBE9159859.1 hypothetical protein [Nodosilinea sp. LEGE 06152]